MKRIFFIVSLVLLACTASLPLSAKVRLPRLVSDRMVLQRDTELKIWGRASPGEKVTVRFRGKHYNTEADAKGNWLVHLHQQQERGPFIMDNKSCFLCGKKGASSDMYLMMKNICFA